MSNNIKHLKVTIQQKLTDSTDFKLSANVAHTGKSSNVET